MKPLPSKRPAASQKFTNLATIFGCGVFLPMHNIDDIWNDKKSTLTAGVRSRCGDHQVTRPGFEPGRTESKSVVLTVTLSGTAASGHGSPGRVHRLCSLG